MKTLKIQWRHYDKEGETCTRCNNTRNNIKQVLELISKDKKNNGIKIDYHEIKLKADKMHESNMILINGLKLEDILNATVSENFCHSCSCLAGAKTNCRTIKTKSGIIEVITQEMIIEAIQKVLMDV